MNFQLKTACCILGCVFLLQDSLTLDAQAILDQPKELGEHRLVIEVDQDANGKVSRGHYRVFENREAQSGRKIKLKILVFHATGSNPKPDPIFMLAGGPGQGAADVNTGVANSALRKNRDIVLVNQRGTGGDNRLSFSPQDGNANSRQKLGPLFDPEQVRAARDRLSKTADLRMYSTPIAMDDLNEVRQALGYDQINLMGGSYGTRAALVYIRRHGETVRTATLNGVAPIPFVNPLYHAQSAQRALDLIFDEVESSPIYSKHFPGLRKKFAELLKKFDEGPIEVEVRDGGELEKVQLSRDAFTNAVRVQMYYLDTSRKLPVLLWRAINGDLRPFAESSIQRNRAIGQTLAMGMLLCVTAAEDVSRIDLDSIEELTSNTFTGGSRVHRQMAACKNWPKSILPEDFGEPVKSDVPTLILSGILDPVTPPKWGELVAKNFPNSLHIVAPAAHGVGGPCINKIRNQFLKTGTVANLDVSCVKEMKLPPLYLPQENFE